MQKLVVKVKVSKEFAARHSFAPLPPAAAELGRMHRAIRACGGVTEMEGLVRCGASVDAVDERGRTALHVACAAGNDEVIVWLLQQGASHDIASDDGRQALHCAAATGHVLASRRLLEAGARVNARDANGETPASLARKAQHLDCVRVMLDVEHEARRR